MRALVTEGGVAKGVWPLLGGGFEHMSEVFEAIYEDGVLRPLEKLSLRPKQRVFLRIDESLNAVAELEDKAFAEYCRAQGDPNVTLEEVRQALAMIPGSLTEACSAERDED
jgi:predicted DNA-binding antitoxin AbrB/MazE fold protein